MWVWPARSYASARISLSGCLLDYLHKREDLYQTAGCVTKIKLLFPMCCPQKWQEWSLIRKKKAECSPAIFATTRLLGRLDVAQALRRWKKKKKTGLLFHLLAGRESERISGDIMWMSGLTLIWLGGAVGFLHLWFFLYSAVGFPSCLRHIVVTCQFCLPPASEEGCSRNLCLCVCDSHPLTD